MAIENLNKKEEKDLVSKILFTGLDNGGKSSIILALQREISQIAMLKPTRQAQRKIFEYLGRQISEWDLGGQKRYRIAYLKEPTKYFDNTSVCIYVIDVQDKERLGESLSYFNDVIAQFRKLNLEKTPLVYIFFNKMDPDFLKEEQIHIDGLISDIKDKIAKIVKSEFTTTFFNTTIYDLWSIISAFSQILLKLYPQSELLDKTIQEFAEKIKPCDAILILDSNSLVIGQYFKNDEAKETLASSTPYFLTLNDSLNKSEAQNKKMVLQQGDYVFYLDQFKIAQSEEPIFLMIMKPDNKFPEEMIDSFVTMIKSLI
jgi:Ras-related GTP-binding protein A/B